MKAQSVRDLKSEIMTPASGAARAFAAKVAPDGIALGISAGKRKHDYRLRAYVATRAAGEAVQAKARGEADIVWVDKVMAQVATSGLLQQARTRMRAGLSTGHTEITAGTMGGLGKKRDGSPGIYVISNAHVFAPPGARAGDMLVQPGPLDAEMAGINPRDIAVLAEMQQPSPAMLNVMDSAIGRLLPGVRYLKGWPTGFPRYTGMQNPVLADIGQIIVGTGRTTAREKLVVQAVEVDGVSVDHGSFVARFVNQVDATPAPGFMGSRGGDSGTLHFRERNGRLGFHLHAGGRDRTGVDHTFLAPGKTTMDHYNLDLIAA